MCARCHPGPGCQLPFMYAKAQEGSDGLLMARSTAPRPQATATVTPRVPRRDQGIEPGGIPHRCSWCPTGACHVSALPLHWTLEGTSLATWAPHPLRIQSGRGLLFLCCPVGLEEMDLIPVCQCPLLTLDMSLTSVVKGLTRQGGDPEPFWAHGRRLAYMSPHVAPLCSMNRIMAAFSDAPSWVWACERAWSAYTEASVQGQP